MQGPFVTKVFTNGYHQPKMCIQSRLFWPKKLNDEKIQENCLKLQRKNPSGSCQISFFFGKILLEIKSKMAGVSQKNKDTKSTQKSLMEPGMRPCIGN